MKKKNEVYVVVDTPKKAEKLKKVLDMFGEEFNETDSNAIKTGAYKGSAKLYDEFNKSYFAGINWTLMPLAESKTEVSIKKLKRILAKEHLKVGDYVVLNGDLIGKVVRFVGNSEILILDYENDNVTCLIKDFKRYATPEEIALLEPKEIDKFAELKEAHKNGAVIQVKGKRTGRWNDIDTPTWNEIHEYRIKPEEKPKVGDLVVMYNSSGKFVCIKHLTEFDKLNLEHCPEFASYKLADKELVFDLLFNK